MSLNYNSILLRYGEVGLKSQRKRPYFERFYASSIRQALERNSVIFDSLENAGGRFILHTGKVNDALVILRSVPGIQSMSPAVSFSFSNIDDLLDKAKSLGEPFVKDVLFRVTTRRTGKHSFSSMDVSRRLGELLLPFSRGVSLHNPEQTLFLEIRGSTAYFFVESFQGLDGMPSASSGKALCLFSGGIDSPVAAFHMLKRGVALDYLFIDISGDDVSFRFVAQLFNHLSSRFSYNYTPRFIRVDAKKLLAEISKRVAPSFRQLALKIAFYKLAERFVNEKNYMAFCTGESLAQKSSQTLPSLRFIDSHSSVLVLRPLITMDKLEITAIADKIGTFGASQFVKEVCDLSDGEAVTATPLPRDRKQIFDMSDLIDEIFSQRHDIFKGRIREDDSSLSHLNQTIPADIITVDIRLPSLVEKDPLPVDEEKYYSDILLDLSSLDSSKKYLFVCEHGVHSRSLAYACSQKKISAFALSKEEFLAWKSRNNNNN